MSQNKFIKDKEQFEEALYWVTKTFNHEEKLPNQIFKSPFQKTVVFDYDYAMSRSFWNELEEIINLSGDSFVIMAVLDPDPVEYYYKEFSQYNWSVLEKGNTADDYWSFLEQGPEGSPADAILFNSEIVLWLSSSMKWAIWGERSYGICVLGFNDDIIGNYNSKSCFTMDEAINNIVSLNFRNYTVPEEIISKLIKHYSN